MSRKSHLFDATELEAAARELGVRMIVLFGSQAGGPLAVAAESDIDLAIRMLPGRSTSLSLLHDRFDRVFLDTTELDLVRLETADPLFRREIMRAGELLWGDVDEFHEYRLYAYRDFIDSADLRELERRLFEKKMKHLGRLLGRSN